MLAGGAPDPLGPVIGGSSAGPLGPVFGGGSLEAPELVPGVDSPGPLGAGMDALPAPVSGEDEVALPPLSDDEPLDDGLSFDDEDDDDADDDEDPESLGISADPADEPESLEADPADEPESLEPPDDSPGDIGASHPCSIGGMAALAVPAPVQSSPAPRPVTNAARIARCLVPMVRPLGTPRQCRRLQTGAVTYLGRRCQPSGLIFGLAPSLKTTYVATPHPRKFQRI